MRIQTGSSGGCCRLVKGAASGIGRATALLPAQEGACIAAADIDGEGTNKVAEKIGRQGGQALAVPLDVTSESAWQAAVDGVLGPWGRLDIAVNNAGVSAARPAEETTLEDWRRVIAMNVNGVATDESSCMTGTKLVIDGGCTV